MSTISDSIDADFDSSSNIDNVNETRDSKGMEAEKETTSRGSDAVSRWSSAILFWAICLLLSAAGHWVYVAIRTIDRTVSSEVYQAPGREIVWLGHGSLEQSVDSAKSRLAAQSRLDQTTALPFSAFWFVVGFGFMLLATVSVWSFRWVSNGGIQSLVGLLAGHALWIGVVEIGLDLASRRLGLAGAIDVVGGRPAGVHGSSILIQLSGIFLVPIFIGLAFHESNRCVVFQWFRKRLPITTNASPSGRIDNYAARTMMQFFMTVWVCYVAVLWMADPWLGSWGHVALLGTLVCIVVATPYMIWKTVCQTTRARMLRYSVSGAVITWTGIEIASATGMFREPWLDESVTVGIVLVGGSVLLTVMSAVALGRIQWIRREAFS